MEFISDFDFIKNFIIRNNLGNGKPQKQITKPYKHAENSQNIEWGDAKMGQYFKLTALPVLISTYLGSEYDEYQNNDMHDHLFTKIMYSGSERNSTTYCW